MEEILKMPIDKNIKNVYIWHSPATDKTGTNLAAALGAKHGNKKPLLKDACMVIGWGAKTKENVSLGNRPVLNHPDGIRQNRNKLAALETMLKAKVAVAPFTANRGDIGKKKSGVVLPLIGRTKYHQGGKGFWNCPTMSHVQAASDEGAQYFQNLIEIKDEYRLHVFGSDVLYAVKKVQRSAAETADAYVRQELEKAKRIAEKKGQSFDESTAKSMLELQAKQFAQNGANMLVRSNKLGWKFSRVTKMPDAMVAEAIKALKALKLDFGAVDCCIDVAGKPFIIEVNTGPGLEGTTFDTWVTAFKNKIAETLTPKESIKTTVKAPVQPSPAIKQAANSDSKTELQTKIDLMKEMADKADATEAEVLKNVFGKMFG